MRESEKEQGDRNRISVNRMVVLIRKLSESPFPGDETALLREITLLDHPDVKGLVDAIVEKRKGPQQQRRGGR